MKQGWVIKKLDDLCQIELGKTPYRGDKSFWDREKETNNVWLSIADMLNTDGNVVSDSKEYITDKAVNVSKLVKKGTLLLSFKLTLGRLAFAGRDLFTNEAIAALPIKDQKIIDKHFLYQFLSFFDWDKASEGDVKVKGKTLNKAKLKEIEIPLPPLPEQQRIVSILDKAFAAIDKAKANAEQNLKNAKELFESYLQSVFENNSDEWVECNLEENIRLIDYRGRTPEKTEGGVRLITAKNVKLGYLQLEPQEFIAEDNYESWMTRGIPNYGDVIFTTEAPLANVAQIDTDEKLAFAQRIIVMQPNRTKLNPTFLKYMLLSGPIRKRILEKGTGATVVGIKSSLLKKITICFPKSISEQQTIIRQLDALRVESQKLETIYQKKIQDLEELKKSILQKAFSGELNT